MKGANMKASIGVLIASVVLSARDYEGMIFPVRDVVLSTRASGLVTSIPYHEGQFVKTGTVLLIMDSRRDSLQYILAERDLEKSRIQKTNEIESEIQLQLRRMALEDLTITAPFSGIIAKIEAKEFEYIGAGSKAIQLVDISQCITEIHVDPVELERIRKPKTVITVLDGNETVIGAFLGYNPLLEPGVRLFLVKIKFPNKHNWSPGASVAVRF
jgi:multidrug resistance efflux pump